MIWLYVAAAIAFAAVAGYAKIEHSGKLTAQAQTESCNTARVAMGEQIKQQNAAVEALAAEGAKKAAAGTVALAKAGEKAKVWEDNAARLRAVLTAPRPAGEAAQTTCAEAWTEIKR